MKYNHIQINVIENQVECLHCGASYKASFKKPIEFYPSLLNAFMKDHKYCIKPKRKK